MTSSARSSGALLTALLLVACGGSPSTVGAHANTTLPDQAHLATTVGDPRMQDPTAVQAGPIPPASVGTSVPVGKGAPANGFGGGKSRGAPPSPAPANDATAKAPAGTETDPPSKITARHVLVQWMGSDRAGKSVLRTRDQALALIEEVQRRAKAGDDLGRLAVEYSDEPNAGARGGSLGRFGRGQMVGAFEAAVFKLKVGEISDIVETPFGFHIIQRTE